MRRAVVGILAHVDAGKTTLIESLLYRTGTVRSLGSVDGGSSHLDHHALERQRGITIYAKQAVIEHRGVELSFLDTPGHVDFSSEAERTLAVLDLAILVVDGGEGVRGHVETLWRLLMRHKVPTLVFANKMDLAGRERDEILALLQERLSDACLDFSELTVREQEDGVLDTDIDEQTAEACAAEDEEALDEFLESGALATATLRRLVEERKIFPCLFGSALRQEGVDALLDAVAALAPVRDWPAEFGARVFKISHDRSGVRESWLKVTGGSLAVKQQVEQVDGTQRLSEKVDQVRVYMGSRFSTAQHAEAGQVCAVTGLSLARAGMALGAEREREGNDDGPALVPAFESSVLLGDCDVHRVHSALKLLTEEDPLLGVRWDERLQELQVQLMGTVQLEVLQATLLERFGLNVGFGPGSVLYRETISAPATGIGHFEPLRHYAEVHLLLEPLPKGSGVRFGTRCRTDDLDLNWQRLILTNAMERDHIGVLAGAPLTDVRITLLGGQAHKKHTEGGDFRQATYRAVRQALMQARERGGCVLLEPWYRFALKVPDEQVGRALADLQRMSARAEAPSGSGKLISIEGVAPASEMRDYAVKASAYTHGMGSLSLESHGYEPCHETDVVIARAAYSPEADLPNTPDSVFCSHGAGHTVKWSEVPQAAHVHPDPASLTDWREADAAFFGA